MPLNLQNLDDRTYADLVEEARARIPALDPEWTNHNPSDPGITLLELLAWRTEMLVYRTNQVPVEHVLAFLKLLKGPGWQPTDADRAGGDALAETTRDTVLDLRRRFRAVTAEDFEYLATTEFNEWRQALADSAAGRAAGLGPCLRAAEYLDQVARAAMGQGASQGPPADACPWCMAGAPCPTLAAEESLADWWRLTGLPHRATNLPSHLPPVARARCVAERDLEQRRIERRRRAVPGHVSLVIVPGTPPPADDPLAPERAAALADALWTWLDERRTLTTHHHVVAPRYTSVRLRALVVLRQDTPDAAAAAAGTSTAAALVAAAAVLPFAGLPDAVRREWGHVTDLDPRQPLRRVLERFFDPVQGGRDGAGWPFGRSVYVSELYELLERQESVEYVAAIQVAAGEPGARLLWNGDGDAYGLALGPETGDPIGAQLLPRLKLTADDVIVCNATVPVEVVIDLPAAPADMDEDTAVQVEGAMNLAVKGLFPPFGMDGSPDPVIPATTAPEAAALLKRGLAAIFRPVEEMQRSLRGPRAVSMDDVAAALRDAPPGFRPASVAFRADAERLSLDGQRRQVVRFHAGEHAEVRVTLRREGGAP